jgi:ferredoxin-thioredoxin reductase catalytic subunit
MASIAELEAVVLKGELGDIERKYKLSYAPTREATTQNTEKSAVLCPATIELNEIKEEEKIMNLAFEEANEIYNWGMRTVLIYAVLLWSFLIWAVA